MRLKKYILVFIVFAFHHVATCQTVPDSLKGIINSELSNPNEISQACSELGFFYLDSEFASDSCKKFVNKALDISTEEKDKNGVFKNLYLLGRLASLQGNNEKCDSILAKAYQIEGINRNTNDFVKLLNIWGITKDLLADYRGALKVYHEGIQIAENNELYITLTKLYNNISIVYRYMGDDEKAMEYLKKASRQRAANFGDDTYINTDANLADLYLKLGYLDSVRNMFPIAIEHYKKITNYGAASNWMMIRGLVEITENNFSEALNYYKEALDEIQLLKDGSGKNILTARCYYDIGDAYYRLQNFSEALKYFKEGNHYEKLVEDKNSISTSYWMISKCFEGINQYDSALVYSNKHNKLNTQIVKEVNSKEIARIEYAHELEKQKEQQLIKEIKLNSRVKFFRITALSISLMLLLTFILLYLLQKNRKQKIAEAKLKEDNLILKIENKEKEVTTNVLYLLKKNEFLAQLTESLQELNNKIIPENKTYMRQIIQDIERNTFKDSWEEFEKRFQEVHVDFYKNLSVQHPDLTPNELKLSAFLKLNMSSKDISSITNQSVDSLKVARYRLRKKLRLAKGENLIAFLAKY